VVGRGISARAMEHVAGYAIALGITIRGPEERSLRKSLDKYIDRIHTICILSIFV
jgi:2,4-didehydro-3-deoxy-L-rhamnonate hydrolase